MFCRYFSNLECIRYIALYNLRLLQLVVILKSSQSSLFRAYNTKIDIGMIFRISTYCRIIQKKTIYAMHYCAFRTTNTRIHSQALYLKLL